MTSLESSFQAGKVLQLSILVDTSQRDGRLLIFDQNHQIQSSAKWSHPLRHTDQLLLEFKKCHKLIDDNKVSKIYFISGPGSFTGLRVGASFVKTIGLVNPKQPIYCINSFKITASHVLKTLKLDEDFSVCISSIGNMVFQADYKVSKGLFQDETVHTDGAHEYLPPENKVFSPNHELNVKFPDITHLRPDEHDYIQAVKEHDLNKASIKTYTHLDLYPLYLRKSEAEEKYRYDKAKL